jgi:tetratricopeptide (TPR) repeat protein
MLRTEPAVDIFHHYEQNGPETNFYQSVEFCETVADEEETFIFYSSVMRVFFVLIGILLAQSATPGFASESSHKKTEAHTTSKKDAKSDTHSSKKTSKKSDSSKKTASSKKEKANSSSKVAGGSKKSARSKGSAANNKNGKRYGYSRHHPASHTQGPAREATIEEIFPEGHRLTDDEKQEATAIGLYCDNGNWKGALKSANQALKRHPERWWLQAARAAAAANLNRPKDVIDAVNAALAWNQGDANKQNVNQLLLLKANAQSRLNLKSEAAQTYLDASKLLPKDPYSRAGAAWLFATANDPQLRNGRAAVDLATQAVKLTGEKDATMLDVLAAAYAEQGNFALAQKWEAKAILKGDSQDIPYYQHRLQSYQAFRPWRETES